MIVGWIWYKYREEIMNFRKQKQTYNGVKIFFVGDLMYDRWVQKYLSTPFLIQKHFSYRDTQTLDTGTQTIRQRVKESDFVGLNLETPIGKRLIIKNDGTKAIQNTCQRTGKSVAFCSHERILSEIKSLWFNIVWLANNHAMDGGVDAHKTTIQALKDYKIKYFGNMKHGPYLRETYVYTGEKQWHKFARHSFDTIIYKGVRKQQYCDQLKKYKKNSYNNFVSIHRWDEYQIVHNQKQQDLAHYLMDCGADMIIGHHPHVIQDIGRYKDKPIIYSLGNFLFDQWFSEETKRGMYVAIDYPRKWKPTLVTGVVDVYANDVNK